MDISTRSRGTWVNEDQRWIGNGGEPIGRNRSIILDRSAFTEADHYPNGFIPSGTPLARNAATGMYVPYARGTQDVNTITRTATGGTFTLTRVGGGTTAAIPATAAGMTAAAVQAAIDALPDVEAGDFVVAGADGGPLTITASPAGNFAAEDVVWTVDAAAATGGTVTDAETTSAGAGRGYLFASIPVDRNSTGDLAAALFWNGEVIAQYLPTMPAANTIDDAFRRDVANHISHV